MATQVINTRYEIIETLAPAEREPFVVSKARDITEGRVVMLEILPADRIVGGAALRAAFGAAVQEAARLDHPHIARVYDQGESGPAGDLYIATEYLQGITLKERVRRVAPFSLTVAADIAVAVADALDYAHRAGVLHGDLRPQNVVLSPEGQTKVLDFACGRAALALAPGAAESARRPYAAPEVGLDGPPTVAGDIYALGAMLYEMLTGTVPQTGERAVAPSPRTINQGVPQALDGIVQKALQPDPASRYRNAALMLADLQAVRDALRSGRSLAWSPLAEKRLPRQPADATIIGNRPAGVAVGGAGALSAAADELAEERYAPVEREPSNILGKVLTVLFIVAVLGVIGLSWYFTRFLAIPNDVMVPNLIGKTFDEAQSIAQQQHFHLAEGSSDYSDKWPENQIYQQDPPAGRAIKAGADVTVARSLGPRLLTIPNLTGMTRERSRAALKDAGLPPGTITDEASETVPKGVVIRQTPAPGERVARNTAVNFVVSSGLPLPDVPDDVQAKATASDKVEVSWKPAAHAQSYTVTRTVDGNNLVVAKGIPDTHYTDTGLSPNTDYYYTVNALNTSGPSSASEPVLATTPAKLAAPPLVPPITPVPQSPDTGPSVPPEETAPDQTETDTSATPPRLRQFTIKFRVPRHPGGTHRVQFYVQDATGMNLVYDESRAAGDRVDAPVQAFGNRVTFRIVLDGKLVRQQTL